MAIEADKKRDNLDSIIDGLTVLDGLSDLESEPNTLVKEELSETFTLMTQLARHSARTTCVQLACVFSATWSRK